MTKDDCIKAISEFIGMPLEPTEHPKRYAVMSPTNKRLFVITVSNHQSNEWAFGGHGEVLSEHWHTLCNIGRQR